METCDHAQAQFVLVTKLNQCWTHDRVNNFTGNFFVWVVQSSEAHFTEENRLRAIEEVLAHRFENGLEKDSHHPVPVLFVIQLVEKIICVIAAYNSEQKDNDEAKQELALCGLRLGGVGICVAQKNQFVK